MQHRSIWLVVMVVGGPVKVGGFPAVGELHTEAEELIVLPHTCSGCVFPTFDHFLLLSRLTGLRGWCRIEGMR